MFLFLLCFYACIFFTFFCIFKRLYIFVNNTIEKIYNAHNVCQLAELKVRAISGGSFNTVVLSVLVPAFCSPAVSGRSSSRCWPTDMVPHDVTLAP